MIDYPANGVQVARWLALVDAAGVLVDFVSIRGSFIGVGALLTV